MSWKIYTLADVWKEKNSGQKFLPFLYPFEIKKGLNLGRFSETILQMAIFGEKQKNFFFQNFIKMLKTLWSSIFDQRICWVTNWVFSKKYPFFSLFDQKFRNHPKNGHFGWKTEKLFFFENFIKMLKPCSVRFLIKEFTGLQIKLFFQQIPPFLPYFFQFFFTEGFSHFLMTFS